MRPRETLRCLTRLGINIGFHLRGWGGCGFGSRGGSLGGFRRFTSRSALSLHWRCFLSHAKLVGQHFALINPNSNSDDSVGGFRLGLAVIDVGTNRVKRDLAHLLD